MKVTPSVGCVKYKAQHIVLAVRIPVLMRGKWPGGAKNGGFGCGFSRKGAKLVEFLRGLLVSNRASFEGRRGGGEGQGAGVVQIGVDGGGNVGKGTGSTKIGCPILATVLSSIRWPSREGAIRFWTGPGSAGRCAGNSTRASPRILSTSTSRTLLWLAGR